MVKKLWVLIFVAFLLANLNLFAQLDIDEDVSLTGGLNALRVAVPFLTISPDSRASSMGDIGVASSPDANSQHWNPAKFAFIENEWGVSLSYTPWLRNLINDINLSYLSGFYRLDDQQVVSASLLYFSMGEIIFTSPDPNAPPQRTHNANEFAFDMAYSRKFSDYISGGVGFRFINSDLTGGFAQQGQPTTKAGQSYAADISVYYQRPLRIDNKDAELALGLNIRNIGTKLSYNDDATKDFIPITLKLGPRFSMDLDSYNSVSFMFDANKFLVPTPPIYGEDGEILFGMDSDVSVVEGMIQSFYDAPDGFKEELREFSLGLGVEYVYSKQFAVRAGYFDEHSTKGNRKYFTIGAGVKYNIFNLDFAYLVPRAGQANPLANTVRFTLAFEFESSQPGPQRRR